MTRSTTDSTRPGARRPGSFLALGALAAVAFAGCTLTKAPADGAYRARCAERAVPLAADAWPARFVLDRVDAERRLGADDQGTGTVWEARAVAEPVGRSVVLWGGIYPVMPGYEPRPTVFRTCVFREPPKVDAPIPAAAPPDSVLAHLVGLGPRFAALGALRTQSPVTVIWTLSLPEAGPVRGLCVRLRSIGPPRFEAPIDAAMLARGWAVLAADGWSMRVAAEGASGVPETALARATRVVEDMNADWAYQTESAVLFAERQAPELQGLPRVLIGCSFGALVAAPAAARWSPAPAAMVLVGGGADALRVIAHASGEVTDGGGLLPVGPHGEDLTPEEAEAGAPWYLERARLDPYNTAPGLAGVPTLLVQGDRDGIVLSRFGDLLWERLGRPERWLGNYGHTLLFYLLPDSAGAIADWIQGHAGDRLGGGGGGGVGAVPGGGSGAAAPHGPQDDR